MDGVDISLMINICVNIWDLKSLKSFMMHYSGGDTCLKIIDKTPDSSDAKQYNTLQE